MVNPICHHGILLSHVEKINMRRAKTKGMDGRLDGILKAAGDVAHATGWPNKFQDLLHNLTLLFST